MTFAGLNYLAVLAAAVAGWLVGAAYYTTLSAQWMAAQGKTKDDFRREMEGKPGSAKWLPFVLAFVAQLIMAWVLAGLLGHLGPGQVTFWNGVISAAFVWVGFVATTIAVNNMFGMKKVMLSVIDGGHWLIVLIVIGAIIGAFGA
jgi:Protein of unknown function (DUF1761)